MKRRSFLRGTILAALATVTAKAQGLLVVHRKAQPSGSSNALVAGAGTVEANGFYDYNGTSMGRPYYNRAGSPNDPTVSSIFWDGTNWNINDSTDVTLYNNNAEDVAVPWLSAEWDRVDGVAPSPTVTQV